MGFRKLRKLPQLDMNPMVDMAFLLVSFFMMTTTFKTDSPVEISLPDSHSEIKIPEKNMATVTVGADGLIYFGIDNKFNRMKMIEVIGKQSDITFSKEQIDLFSLQSSFGVPIDELNDFLISKKLGKTYVQSGIPADTSQNELKKWILASRISNPNLRYSIHADESVKYPIIHQCIESFRDLNITRFNLITEGDDSTS